MFHRMMNYGELEPRPGASVTFDLITKHLPRYKRHDDLIIVQEAAWEEFKRAMPLPVVEDENSPFSIDEDELASLVCQTIQRPVCMRLAVDRGAKSDVYRSPNIRMVLGSSTLVTHKDNHIIYRFDISKCMFSFGSVREKVRMAELDCSDEVVVDLFAGLGYYTLPLLVHAKAKHVYACEWNPDVVQILRGNLKANGIADSRYTVIEGDNRKCRPENVAQRVVLGILPSCQDWLSTALDCVDKTTGAILHCHDLVETKPPPEPATPYTLPEEQSSSGDFGASCEHNQPPTDDQQKQQERSSPVDSEPALNQSISSSSTSSHSTIEKLSVPSDELAKLVNSSESDNSPVLLEKPTISPATTSTSSPSLLDTSTHTNSSSSPSTNDYVSLASSNFDDSILDLPRIEDSLTGSYEARGLALIESIQRQLDALNMSARLLQIQPVKSHGPHTNHAVFDIEILTRRGNGR